MIELPDIIRVVCLELGVEPSCLGGPCRHKRVVMAREAYVHLAKLLTTHSYPEISRHIGKTHSTLITAHHRLEYSLETGKVWGVDDDGRDVLVSSLIRKMHKQLTDRAARKAARLKEQEAA